MLISANLFPLLFGSYSFFSETSFKLGFNLTARKFLETNYHNIHNLPIIVIIKEITVKLRQILCKATEIRFRHHLQTLFSVSSLGSVTAIYSWRKRTSPSNWPLKGWAKSPRYRLFTLRRWSRQQPTSCCCSSRAVPGTRSPAPGYLVSRRCARSGCTVAGNRTRRGHGRAR